MADRYFHLYKADRGTNRRMRFKVMGRSVIIESWEQKSANRWTMLHEWMKTVETARLRWDNLVSSGWSVKQ